jgi:hypothetical protein
MTWSAADELELLEAAGIDVHLCSACGQHIEVSGDSSLLPLALDAVRVVLRPHYDELMTYLARRQIEERERQRHYG